MMGGIPNELIYSLRKLFEQYNQIERVVLYGSRAKGVYKKGSDIDLCIISDATFNLMQIEDAIDELNSPYLFDISIFNQIESDTLKEHIQRNGLTLFSRKDTQ